MNHKICKEADISAFVSNMTRSALQAGQAALLGMTEIEEHADAGPASRDLTHRLFHIRSLSSMIKAAWAGLEQGWDENDPRSVSAHYRIAERSLQELTRRLNEDVRNDNCALLEAYLTFSERYLGSEEPACMVARKLLTATVQGGSLQFCLLSAISLRTNYPVPDAELSAATIEHVESTFRRLAQVPGLGVRMHPRFLTPTQVYSMRPGDVYRLTGGRAPGWWNQPMATDCRDSDQPGVKGGDAVSTNTRFIALFVTMPSDTSEALDRNFLNNPEALSEWECLSDVLASPEFARVMVFPPLTYFNAVSRAQVASVLTNLLPSLYPQAFRLGADFKALAFSIHREPDCLSDIREIRLSLLDDQGRVIDTACYMPIQPLFPEVVEEALDRLAEMLKVRLSSGVSVFKSHQGAAYDGEKWVPALVREPLPLKA